MFGRSFWAGMFFLIITNTLDGLSPLLIKRALDEVTATAPWSDVAQTAAMFFAVMAGLAMTRYAWRTFFGAYHTNASDDLRKRLFDHLGEMSPNFYSRMQTGELMSLLVNDIQAFRQAIGSSVLILVDGAVIIMIILPVMIMLNPSWTWKTLIFLPLIPFMIKAVGELIFSRYKVQQDQLSLLSGFTQETVTGIRVLKSFVQEKARLRGYRDLNLHYEKLCNDVAIVDSLFAPIMEFGVAAGSVILIFIAAPDLLTGAASLGTFIAFQRYITKMVWPMTAFGWGLSQYQKGMASFARIREVLETATDVPDNGRNPLPAFESLEARGLSFLYPGAPSPVLRSLSFRFQARERLGIVGPVGSGKSTLAQLLVRLLPSEPDRLFVNGASIESYKLDELRSRLRLVTQEPLLFSMSVEENLKMPTPALTTERIRQGLEQVEILREIDALPSGSATELGERGVNLSGGQKQRISLARGLLSDPDVLILDDTLSAVDHATEEKLIASLRRWDHGLILISHRLSVLQSCDRILVLSEGGIEAQGTWSEMLATSPTFRQLAELQGVRA